MLKWLIAAVVPSNGGFVALPYAAQRSLETHLRHCSVEVTTYKRAAISRMRSYAGSIFKPASA